MILEWIKKSFEFEKLLSLPYPSSFLQKSPTIKILRLHATSLFRRLPTQFPSISGSVLQLWLTRILRESSPTIDSRQTLEQMPTLQTQRLRLTLIVRSKPSICHLPTVPLLQALPQCHKSAGKDLSVNQHISWLSKIIPVLLAVKDQCSPELVAELLNQSANFTPRWSQIKVITWNANSLMAWCKIYCTWMNTTLTLPSFQKLTSCLNTIRR